MAPVALEPNPSYLPLILVLSHGAAVVSLSSIIGLGLYRSYKGLGPAQDTRQRVLHRSKLTTLFGGLAVLSFFLAASSGISYLNLSYNVWASERGIEVPNTIFGGSGADGNATGTSFQITRWLSDTPIYLDALEIVTEKARRRWWGEQLDLATIPWAILLAVEGRRRQIPFLWAYASLAQLVSLSFAQNLFYLAMLLTPSPIPLQESRVAKLLQKAFPPKPANWFPKRSVFLAPIVLNDAAIISLPFLLGTAWFPAAVVLAKGLSFAPLILPAIVPESWGTVGRDPHDSYRGVTKVFQVITIVSCIFHARTTLAALSYNLPDAYKHRHSIKIPFDTEKRSLWERSATAFEKVLGAVNDHPVVAAAGKDVLLSVLSLGLWAAVRAMDLGDFLTSCAAPWYNGPRIPWADEQPVVQEKESYKKPTSDYLTLRRGGRARKVRFPSVSSSNGLSDEGTPTPAPRRRGRPRKIKPEPEPEPEPELDLEEVPGDTTYEPSPEEKAGAVGDSVSEDGVQLELAALTWGLSILGGLCAGSAAVLGAECIAR